MIEPKLALKVVKRGTHLVKLSEINNDVPSPCECVAEALWDVEYCIGELVKVGGAANNSAFYARAKNALAGLNLVLNAAAKQGWQLEVERNPDCNTPRPAPTLAQESAMRLCEIIGQKGYKGSDSFTIS